jgi:hypothetical protein
MRESFGMAIAARHIPGLSTRLIQRLPDAVKMQDEEVLPSARGQDVEPRDA